MRNRVWCTVFPSVDITAVPKDSGYLSKGCFSQADARQAGRQAAVADGLALS